ncbi:MAG: DUF72 domain-containing protein [Pseudomonadota bacterium]
MSEIKSFFFRTLHPDIFLGTASDRYAGWIGQIYPKEKYGQRISRRPKVIKGKTFSEETLPVDSLEDYFEHFSILEIDYTFYRLLLDETGKPTPNYFLLKKYGDFLKAQDYLFLKVPQVITARKIHKGPNFEGNETYLNPHIFTEQFYQPALHLLGPKIKGFIFEQEYHRQSERLPVSEVASCLDHFFKAIPRDDRYHLELRTESYLQPLVFEVLEHYGVGQVLSHWTWLPPLEKQFNLAGRRFFNAGRQAVVRLMTPLGRRYEDAYEKAFPFDKLIEGMLQTRMIEETVRLMRLGIERQIQMNIIINNRSGGNAPLIARQVAEQFQNSGRPTAE